jgi:hypothetical protein
LPVQTLLPLAVLQLQPETEEPEESFGQAQELDPEQNVPVPAGSLSQQPLYCVWELASTLGQM